MFVLRSLLFPFSLLFDLITRIRNHLYDIGWKPSTAFEVPVIVIGNLSAGGTGKTPMVEYLVRLLKADQNLTILSRGYGRATRGFRLAEAGDTPESIGDEPHQLFQKFAGRATVAVGEDRVLAISQILHEYPTTSAILLDDAFQHRRVRASFKILLTDFSRPFYKDFVLPTGMLREARKGAARADVIVVTKSPEGISPDEMNDVTEHVAKYSSAPVFFTKISYAEPVSVFDTTLAVPTKVILVTGIGNAVPLHEYVSRKFDLVRHYEFSDHHRYTRRDIRKITRDSVGISILTTEKDRTKLASLWPTDGVNNPSLWFLPIRTEFVKNGKDFDGMIENVVSKAAVDKND